MTKSKQPNILLIQADQLAADLLKVFNPNGKAKTPHIDQLAESGVVFTNSYCSSPLCAPSRASLYSGLKASNCGAYGNGEEFSSSIPTFLHFLRMKNYRTVLSGKAHFVGPDQMHGFEKRLTTDVYPANFKWTLDWNKVIVEGPGTSVKNFDAPPVVKTNGQLLFDQEVQFRALEFLRYERIKPKDSPFFLQVSFSLPHDPFQITKEYWDLYTDDEVGMPKEIWPLEKHHPYNQWLQKLHGVVDHPLSNEKIVSARRAHFGMIAYQDALIGELIAELKSLDLYDNTIVIFLSDHGEMLGEKSMWFKRTFYEQAIKVPLIISWPGQYEARKVDEVVSQIDFAPTIAEIIGFENHEFMEQYLDGISFCGLLENRGEEWKNTAQIEYLGAGVREPLLISRKDDFKYAYIHNMQPLLFNLKDDPDELNNLAGIKQYQKIENEMHRLAIDGMDVNDLKKKVITAQARQLFIESANDHGEQVSWDYQPFFDASEMYIRGLNFTPYY